MVLFCSTFLLKAPFLLLYLIQEINDFFFSLTVAVYETIYFLAVLINDEAWDPHYAQFWAQINVLVPVNLQKIVVRKFFFNLRHVGLDEGAVRAPSGCEE